MSGSLKLLIVATLIINANGQSLPAPGDCGVFNQNRIVNGEAAVPNSRPYQLLLVTYTPEGAPKSYCGASLITKNHVLTAAHCVDGEKAENVVIYPGLHEFTSSILSKDQGTPLSTIFQHESYSSSRLTNDVAVLRLKNTITLSDKIGLVCLAAASSPQCGNGDPVVASGWGSLTGNPNRTSASRPVELQKVNLVCVPNTQADCKPLTHLLNIFPEATKMCAFGNYSGVCFGDSGGPLVRERTNSNGVKFIEQVGIMSGTIDCSFTLPKPDLYANVRDLYAWIVDKVNRSQ